ncbi:MAG: endonuclease III [Candidatus Helarchaeota archaeon]|nr:endonuclease III [Candidatus Helarchaeota archaeon]
MLEIIEREMDIAQHVKNWKRLSPFESLIRTILSQNTTDKNSFAAFENLASKFEVTPEGLVKVDQSEIQDAIRIAGLHNQKSKRIKEISQIIISDWNSDFSFIYEAPLEEARKKLMDLPGIGNKTADVVLNFVAQRPILPVDTHITRISKRIGLVPQKAKYDEIREAIEALIPEDKIFTIHVSLIFFGRKVCKAINPQCPTCPLTHLCPKLIVKKKKGKTVKKIKMKK